MAAIRRLWFAGVICATLSGCYGMRPSDGGGMTEFEAPRRFRPGGVALPDGYRIELVAQELTFPTAVTFDHRGGVYVTEAGYSYGEMFLTPRLLKVEPDGRTVEVARGDDNGPWTGAAWRDGAFYVAEGGELRGGRILRVEPDGQTRVLLDRLPSTGDHHTNGVVFGPDGWLYFAIGTATNSAVIGPDNDDFGWLERYPQFSDTPCRDVTLAGVNYTSENPLSDADDTAVTGAFKPFGTPSREGEVVSGRLPCNGAVFRVAPQGGTPELVAWGSAIRSAWPSSTASYTSPTTRTTGAAAVRCSALATSCGASSAAPGTAGPISTGRRRSIIPTATSGLAWSRCGGCLRSCRTNRRARRRSSGYTRRPVAWPARAARFSATSDSCSWPSSAIRPGYRQGVGPGRFPRGARRSGDRSDHAVRRQRGRPGPGLLLGRRGAGAAGLGAVRSARRGALRRRLRRAPHVEQGSDPRPGTGALWRIVRDGTGVALSSSEIGR